MRSLIESQIEGGDEDKPAKLIELLEQIKSELISSNNLNSERMAKQKSTSAHLIETLTSVIKEKDREIYGLSNKLRESEEKYK